MYNSHRQQIERLQFEIRSKKAEQNEIEAQLGRWRTQWEEEMAEKNAVAAELLTLRSEFEKVAPPASVPDSNQTRALPS